MTKKLCWWQIMPFILLLYRNMHILPLQKRILKTIEHQTRLQRIKTAARSTKNRGFPFRFSKKIIIKNIAALKFRPFQFIIRIKSIASLNIIIWIRRAKQLNLPGVRLDL